MTYANNAQQPQWTETELEWLKQHYLMMTYPELAKHIHRSTSAVTQKLSQLGLRKTATWTKDQLDFLRQHYASASTEELRTAFGHPLGSVIKKAKQLGLKRPWDWTDDELMRLGEWARQEMLDAEIAHRLNRSLVATQAKRRELKILTKNEWTETEDALLRQHYAEMATENLTVMFLGRSPNAINKRANQLGLEKPAVWSEPMEQLLRQQYPISTMPELLAMFPDKTKRQVKRQARRLGLKKDLATLARCFHTEPGKVPKTLGRWSSWRNAVLRRDEFRCQECGCVKDRLLLQAHHIVPRRDPGCAKYDMGNGICLCRDCHNGIKECEYEMKSKYLAIVASKQENP